jgi:hypothetical protein
MECDTDYQFESEDSDCEEITRTKCESVYQNAFQPANDSKKQNASLHIVLIYASSAFFPITLSKKLDPLPDLSKKNIRLCWYHRKIFFQNIIITSWIIGILMMP